MGITKKAITVGLSAAMLASLVATAFAGSAFAAGTLTAVPTASPIFPNGTTTITLTGTGLTASTVTVAVTSGTGTLSNGSLTITSGTVPVTSGAISGTITFTAPDAAETDVVTVTDATDSLTATATIVVAVGTGSTLAAVPNSANADGVSLVNINVTTAALASATDVIQLTTTLGTFSSVAQPGTFTGHAATNVWASGYTLAATTVYGTTTGVAGGSATVTLVAPSVAGTAIVRAYDIVGGVGAPILIGTTTVAYSASTAASYISVGSPSLSSIQSSLNGGPSIITATVTNSTNGPMANQIVTVAASLGFLLTNGAGYCSTTPPATPSSVAAASCIEVTNSAGQATVYLYGGGVAGTSTITFTSGTLTGSTTVTLGGSFSKVAVSQLVSAGAEGTAYTTATNPILFVTPEDASGNAIALPGGTGDLSFTLTKSIFASTPTWGAYTTGTTISGTTYVGYPLYGTCGPNSGSTTIAISATNEFVVPNTTITASPVTFSCAGTAATFTLTPSATSVAPGGTVTLTVAAKDSAGNAAPDGTGVSVFSNGVGNVVSTSGATSGVTTSGGSATFYFLAPSTAGTASVTAFVANVTAPQTVTITVGTAAPPTTTATAGSVLGLGTSGFSSTTKVAKLGQYVTWEFGFGSAAAGKNVTILVATKSSSGVWSAFKALTGRTADSNGNAFFHWKYSSATWISVRGQLGTTLTPARQARWM